MCGGDEADADDPVNVLTYSVRAKKRGGFKKFSERSMTFKLILGGKGGANSAWRKTTSATIELAQPCETGSSLIMDMRKTITMDFTSLAA